MSIQSPIKDGLFIRPIRPKRYFIRIFIYYYPYIVGILISALVASSLFFVDKPLMVVLLLGYWLYIYLRTHYRKIEKWSTIYPHQIFQFFRVFGLVFAVTVLLYYIYNRTNYFTIVRDDTLWLLYVPAISATSQRGSRTVFFTFLLSVIGCLFLIHPVAGMKVVVPTSWPITLEFINKSLWVAFLSVTSYILIRYMSDAIADLNLIVKVQNRMREMEGSLLRSKTVLRENEFLEKAVEIIMDDLFYNHVNIFRLDKYNTAVTCIAGACSQGKELAQAGYQVDIIGRESIIRHVVKTQKSYVANAVSHDPHYMPHGAFQDTRAELVVPIKVRNRLYGVLDIEVNQPEYFLDEEIKAIEILANHIGWVIDNAEQYDHISWINRIVETIASPIFTQAHLDETLQEIADSALEELKADVVYLYSSDPASKEMISSPIYSGMLFHPELMNPTSTDPDNIVSRLISKSERIFTCENLEALDLASHPLFKPSDLHISTGKITFIEREKIKSNVIIRLLNNGQCVGILFLNFRKPRTFDEWEQKRYHSFAYLAALAIQKMQLQQHIIQKEKTDLANYIHDMLIGDTVGLFKILKTIDLSSDVKSVEKAKEKIELALEATEHLHNNIRWINNLLKENFSGDLVLELDKLFRFLKSVFDVESQNSLVGDTGYISPDLARELYLVIREALTNAVRHGKAKHIQITGTIKPNILNTIISDDGVGFNPKHVKRMNGLLSMKYRIEEMGGVFKLISNPGKGTKIIIKLPLRKL